MVFFCGYLPFCNWELTREATVWRQALEMSLWWKWEIKVGYSGAEGALCNLWNSYAIYKPGYEIWHIVIKTWNCLLQNIHHSLCAELSVRGWKTILFCVTFKTDSSASINFVEFIFSLIQNGWGFFIGQEKKTQKTAALSFAINPTMQCVTFYSCQDTNIRNGNSGSV